MKRIPYGIINYKTLIEENYIYVDKTMYLEKLENVSNAVFYFRPRVFGKSLFTNMMSYYYDINSKDLFDSLFKDTCVYENPTKEKNSYYVLKFDFSAIESADKSNKELAVAFKDKVISGIKGFNNQYDTNIIVDESKDTAKILDSFIRQFQALKLNHKIYIIIDEYDNFLNYILEGSAYRFKSVVEDERILKKFYETVKIYIEKGIIGRFFATGICSITFDSIKTSFNIAKDLSFDLEFNSMAGLTDKEVRELLEKIVDEKDRDNIYNLMVRNYGGYSFNKNASEKVFNTTLIMYLLNYYERFKDVPDKMEDKNVVSNYHKIEHFLKLKNNEIYKDILDKLLKSNEIVGQLVTDFNLLIDLNENDLISLLYYFGYLTIKEYDSVKDKMIFKIPNEVIKETYNDYFIKILNKMKITIDYKRMEAIFNETISSSKITELSEYVSDLLKSTDNRIFMKFDEKYIALIYYTLLRHPLMAIYLEYPCKNGYIDIYLQSQNKEIMKKNIIIELKYIKKQDYTDKLLEEKRKEAKEQLLNYSEDERLGDVCRYLVVFVGNDLKILEEV